jgi:aryl-alcohol dehydrogenase
LNVARCRASKKEAPVRLIQAAVLRRKGGPLRIESLAMQGPGEDEVLVRIVASGICHTDISYVHEWYGAEEGPLVLGHEGAGIVEQVGRNIEGIRRGDHVVLSYESCGRCRACRRGRPAGCRRLYELNFGFRRSDGSNALDRSGVRGHFFGQSSFATHTLSSGRNLVKVPKSLPLALLAPLGCGLQTGAGTVLNSLAVPAGAGIAVFGTGTVGLAAVMAARIRGAAPIIGIDLIPRRLRLARELGATHAIDSRREDVAARIRKITGAGIDFAVESTGNEQLIRLSMELLNPKGIVALLTGIKGPDRLPEGRKALSVVQGDAMPRHFIPRLIAYHRKGLFPFERLVKFYDFKHINRAIADSRRGSTVKPVLRMSDA